MGMQPQPARVAPPRSQHQSSRSYEPPPEPPSGGENDPADWTWTTLFGLGAVYFLAPWSARMGQRFVDKIVGGGAGSGGPPCDNWPDWLCSGAGFDALNPASRLPLDVQAAALLLLFLLFLGYWIYLLLRLPLVPTWKNHQSFSRLVRPSPFIIVFVVAVANSGFLMTKFGWLIINARVWTTFLAAIVGFTYLLGVRALAPKKSSAVATLEQLDFLRPHGAIKQIEHDLDRSKAPARYVLTLLAAVYLLNMGWIAATLIPNTLAAVPPGYNWWCLLWPPWCDLNH